jgi:ABC-2 type transport system ATP-binding protein
VKGLPGEVRVCFADTDQVTVSTMEPSATLIEMLRGDDRPISSVEVHNASLDDLYRSLAVSDDS